MEKDENNMMEEMEHMKDKKNKKIINEDYKLKDYVKTGNLYSARRCGKPAVTCSVLLETTLVTGSTGALTGSVRPVTWRSGRTRTTCLSVLDTPTSCSERTSTLTLTWSSSLDS